VFPILVFIDALYTEPVLERSTARVLYVNRNCLDRNVLGSSWAFAKGISDNFLGEIGGKPEHPEIYLEYTLWKLTHTKAPVTL
jgi:hypothetical protein